MQICTRCLYDASIPGIEFDASGVCSFCHQHDVMEAEYPTGNAGERRLAETVAKIKEDGRKLPYDVIVGVSGGCDSSYMLHLAKERGLRPLAVHFDNTWNSRVAVENIESVLRALDVDLYTYVVDNEEYDDIYRSFLAAGVRDVESPTDIGLAVTLNKACEEHGVKYMFEGHSFRTEGSCPLGWLYMDGRYIKSVHAQFGKLPMRTYPNMPLASMLKWTAFSGLRKIRPLYHVDYVKADAMALLTRDLGWKWYGGHHLENRFTAFYWSYYMPRRFGIDGRLLGYAALVRSGQMTRDEGLALLEEPMSFDPDLVETVRRRLGYSEDEFETMMTAPTRTYNDFPTYKRTFERLRWLFWVLYKAERVPQSFYLKYTRPHPPMPAPSPDRTLELIAQRA